MNTEGFPPPGIQESSRAPVSRGSAATSAEERVLEAAVSGVLADFTTGVDDYERSEMSSSSGREVRAEFVASLAADSNSTEVFCRGIRLRGAKVLGELDLRQISFPYPLVLEDCVFYDSVRLADATLRSLSLRGSRLQRLDCTRASFMGSVDLGKSVVFGEVIMAGATIGGDLFLCAAEVGGGHGLSVRGDALKVEKGMYLDEGFRAHGELRLAGAEIGGQLSFASSRLMNAGGRALTADGIRVRGVVLFRDGFEAKGEVRLPGALIGSSLYFTGASLDSHSDYALAADESEIGGSVLFNQGFSAYGRVSLLRSKIAGSLSFNDSALRNPSGIALNADGVDVGGGLSFDKGFNSEGRVSLRGAEIKGNLTFRKGQLSGSRGIALHAARAQVSGNVLFAPEFRSRGCLILTGATISERLSLKGAILRNPSDNVLQGHGLFVGQSATLADVVVESGSISLIGAKINRQLSFRRARLLTEPDSKLELQESKCGTLFFDGMAERPCGSVNLDSAETTVLVDDKNSWPPEGKLNLANFSYRSIDGDIDANVRIGWLNLQRGFSPSGYEQLIAFYRAVGDVRAARDISVARERSRLRRGRLGIASRLWIRFLGVTVGYGYRPGFAFSWLALLFVANSVVFSVAAGSNVLIPTENGARPTIMSSECESGYVCFQPLLYSIDLLVPGVDLGQESSWRIDTSKGQGDTYQLVALATKMSGLLLITALGAGAARVLRRD